MVIRLYKPLQIDFFHSRTLRTTPAFGGWQVSDGIGSRVSLETSYHSFFSVLFYPSSVSGLTPWSRRKQMLLSSFPFPSELSACGLISYPSTEHFFGWLALHADAKFVLPLLVNFAVPAPCLF